MVHKSKSAMRVSTHFLDTPSDFAWYFGDNFKATRLGRGPVYRSADGQMTKISRLFELAPRQRRRSP
jgi:hypothetical protein